MQTYGAILASLVAAASASPLIARDSCDVSPSGTDASVTALESPSVTTADLCRQACISDVSCKSFLFGLPPNADAPICRLFSVSASQLPAAETNLNAFDVGCTDVPTTAPTSDNPQGTTSSTSDSGSSGQLSSNQQSSQQNGAQQQQKRDIQCSATPAGSSSSPSPMQTLTTPGSLDACLSLCKVTAGCSSVEFGSPSAGAAVECILFSVPVAQLPALGTGTSIVASDVGC